MDNTLSNSFVEHVSGLRVPELLVDPMDASRPVLAIPDYQRGYCWGKKQIEGLLESIWYFDWKDGRTLHLGTVVVHEHDGERGTVWDVVDGQQRLVTLSILLAKTKPNGNALPPLLECETADEDVLKHVRWAAMTIGEWIKNHQIPNGVADIPFDRIAVDVIAIKGQDKLQLAYTFFNAVNSAGKKLSDYDLLKTHHLRFLENSDPQGWVAGEWDALIQEKVNSFNGEEASLVEEVLDASLYRLRRWIRNRGIRNDRGHVFDHYSSYESISGKSPFVGGNAYDAGIVGGMWFFGYARKYADVFRRFAASDAVRGLHGFDNAPRHIRLLHVIRALLFLYYCKFCLDGEMYLNDALMFIIQRIGRLRNQYKITETLFQDPIVLHTVEALDESPTPEHFFKYCVLPTNLYARDYGANRKGEEYQATSPRGIRPAFWQGAYHLFEKLKPGMVDGWFDPATTFVRDFLPAT
ncbi:MAG: DUF262 domain-containing protein [Kiritimatiellae bacterium]|nr:DUF262 domain-containing protein [Kiritimatiellia bacterium]